MREAGKRSAGVDSGSEGQGFWKLLSLGRLGSMGWGRTRKQRAAGLKQMTEALEPRQLLSFTPTPVRVGNGLGFVGSGLTVNSDVSFTSPQVSSDPDNANVLFMTATANYSTTPAGGDPDQQTYIAIAISTDGGATWGGGQLLPVNELDATVANNAPLLSQARDATAAIQRDGVADTGTIFLSYLQRNTTNTAGFVKLLPIAFDVSTPATPVLTPGADLDVYSWAGSADTAASFPTLAVDNTLATYTDASGGTLTNPNAGNIYVAYAAAAGGDSRVLLHVSSDDGVTLSSGVVVNAGTTEKEGTKPKIAISQGIDSNNPRSTNVTPGQVTVLYEDDGDLLVDTIRTTNTGAGGTAGPANLTDFSIAPEETNVPLAVTAPGGTIQSVELRLSITHPRLADLALDLVSPTGTVVNVFGAGALTGVNLGTLNSGSLLTKFSNTSTTAIGGVGQTAPYVGTFSLNIAAILGETANGTWSIRVTDTAAGQAGTLDAAELLVTTSGLTTLPADTVILADNDVNNTLDALPAAGNGMGAQIASDNTLGSFSLTQGNLYVVTTVQGSPDSNTDIAFLRSTDGGDTWEIVTSKLNQDDGATDGFSGAALDANGNSVLGRPQFSPAIAVDNSTGSVAISYYDARFDPSQVRVARMLSVSTDGGESFLPETFLNVPLTVADGATSSISSLATKVLGPVPDNSSADNTARDVLFDFGTSQSMVVVGGRIVAAWAGNRNGLSESAANDDERPMRTEVARFTIPAGPRIVGGTTGTVGQTGDTTNPNNTSDDPTPGLLAPGAVLQKFTIVFDRPVDPASFTTADVTLTYRRPGLLASQPGETIAVTSVTPILTGDANVDFAGAFTFEITLTTPERRAGTYTYAISGDVTERIRTVDPVALTTNPDNQIDQNGDATLGDTVDLALLAADGEVLPITLAGPKVASVNVVSGTSVTTGGRQVNAGITAFDVVFDRPMDPSTVTSSAILRLRGPTGILTRTFTVTANPYAADDGVGDADGADNKLGDVTTRNSAPVNARTYRFALNTPLTLSGDYTIELAPTLKDAEGNSFDPNENAGLLAFKNVREAGSTLATATYASTGTTNIPASGSVDRDLVFADSLTIEDLNVRFSITHPTVADLTIALVSPDGSVFELLSNIVPGGTSTANFTNTVIDDEAVVSITGQNAPFTGSFRSESGTALTSLRGLPTRTLGSAPGNAAAGTWKLRVTNAGTTAGTISDFAMVVTSLTSPQRYSTTTPVTIPAAGAGQSSQADRTLVVPDGFSIQDLNVQVNIAHTDVTRLTLQLISPGGQTIELFSNVGQVGTRTNLLNTILDDQGVTRIQNSQAPFFGTFRPETGSPLANFNTTNSAGTWTLRVINTATAGSASPAGVINSFTLTLAKPVDATQDGLTTVDAGTIGLSIFNSLSTTAQAANTWLAVGPATADGHTGKVGALTVDPSDPTGNTVFAAGASGGVWKTTNFLNNSGQPTWINLTDFGPAFTLNVSSMTIFPRNSNPDDSIVFVLTGDGTTNTPGVGLLRSLNGGRTWDLLNSSQNFDAVDPTIPLEINSQFRDNQFNGLFGNKVVVDPRPTPTGEVIVYAAFSGANARDGLYRSVDSGRNWTRLRAGDATDVVLDQNSGTVNAVSNPTGNLDVIYASFDAEGVFLSPNRGQSFTQQLGASGRPLLRDAESTGNSPLQIPVSNPNQAPSNTGRTLIATPRRFVLSDFPVGTTQAAVDTLNLQYTGWVYALSSNANGTFNGLYVSKDFGANWTRVRLGGTARGGAAIPTSGGAAFDPFSNLAGIFSGRTAGAISVDPTNPAVVYIGVSTQVGVVPQNSVDVPGQLIRVDTTFVADPYALFVNPFAGTGGTSSGTGTGGAVVRDGLAGNARADTVEQLTNGRIVLGSPLDNPSINITRNPLDPTDATSTLFISDVSAVVNDGFGATFSYVGDFMTGRDVQELTLVRDPVSGGVRIYVGNSQSVFTGLINADGSLENNRIDENAASLGRVNVQGARAGNLQFAQVNYGAVQPSDLAATVAGALFYANTRGMGDVQSTSDILTTGNTSYPLPGLNYGENFGNAGGVGVFQNRDDTNRGTVYKYRMPLELGRNTDFFQAVLPGGPDFYSARTLGLLLADENPGTAQTVGDSAQWLRDSLANFAVNPINGQQVIISSHAGRVYSTSNSGQFWLQIGTPAQFNNSQALALAYGAPDNDPVANPTGALNNHLYIGTVAGEVFVTYNGGGVWTNITANIVNDGSQIRSIFTSPNRGEFGVYVATDEGIYFKADSRVAGNWVNITGNLYAITRDAFGDSGLSETYNFLSQNNAQLNRGFRTVVADYRYSIPVDVTDPSAGSFPMLYVAGFGGVFRSLDNGTTWTVFPDVDNDGAPEAGGYLPNVQVTDLDLSVGEIDPVTGRPLGFVDLNDNGVFDSGEARSLDLLLASTDGRGQFAIRLAPIIIASTLGFTADSNVTELQNGEFITTTARPTITGVSQQSGFGSTVTVEILDLTDPNNPVVIGSGVTDEFGQFSVQINNGAISIPSNGLLTVPIGVRATSASGTVGNIPTLVVNFDTIAADLPAPTLDSASDTGSSNSDGITSARRPMFSGSGAESGATITLFANGTQVGTATADSSGNYVIQPTSNLADGVYSFTVKQTDAIGNTSAGFSTPGVSVTIDNAAPAAVPTAPVLTAGTDTGASSTDNITFSTTPSVTGTTTANSLVQILVDGTVVNTVTSNGSGIYTATIGTLAAGTYTVTARLIDVAGNIGTASAGTSVTVDTTAVALAAPLLAAASDTGTVGDNQTGLLRPSFTGSGAEPGATVQLFVDTVLVGSAVALGDGTFTITPTADLTAGTRAVTVRQVDIAGNTSAQSPALSVVVDPTAPTVVGGANLGASENVALTATIGTVSVTNPLTIFSVTVNWGDGNTDTLLVGQSGASPISLVSNGVGGFNIVGTHTYLNPGSFTITITAQASTGGVASATSNVTVVNLPLGGPNGGVVTGGFAVSAVEGAVSAVQTVATFTDPGGTGNPSDYVVSIDWGDGNVTAGTVTFASGTYTVTGQNTYANTGVFTITVSISEGGATSTATSTATVTNAALTIGTATPISIAEGSAFTGTIFTFTNDFAAEPVGDFTATITFGDGTTAQGVITADTLNPGTYIVSTTKTFTDSGTFNGTVTITDNDGGAISGSFTSTVTNVAPTTSAVAPTNVFVGDSLLLAITGGDVSTGDLATGLTYVINWGDNTAFTTIDPTANNTAPTASHVYTTTGTFTITLTVTDKDGGTSTFTTTATVIPLPTVSGPSFGGVPNDTGVVSRPGVLGFTVTSTGGVNPVVTSSNLTLLRNGTVPVDLANVPFTYDQATGAATVDLTNLALADGDYQLQVALSTGTVLPVNFTKLTGDVDGNGRVDSRDRRAVQQRLGSQAVASDPADIDGDGVIDQDDVNLVRANNGRRAVLRSVRLNLNSSRGPTLNFGNITNANGGIIEVTLRNNYRQARTIGELRVADEVLANAQIVGRAWNQPLGSLTLQAGETLRVRVYVTASTNPGRPLAGALSVVTSNVTGLDSRRVSSSIRGKFRF